MNQKDREKHRKLRIQPLMTLILLGIGDLMMMAKSQELFLYNVSTNKYM